MDRKWWSWNSLTVWSMTPSPRGPSLLDWEGHAWVFSVVDPERATTVGPVRFATLDDVIWTCNDIFCWCKRGIAFVRNQSLLYIVMLKSAFHFTFDAIMPSIGWACKFRKHVTALVIQTCRCKHMYVRISWLKHSFYRLIH